LALVRPPPQPNSKHNEHNPYGHNDEVGTVLQIIGVGGGGRGRNKDCDSALRGLYCDVGKRSRVCEGCSDTGRSQQNNQISALPSSVVSHG